MIEPPDRRELMIVAITGMFLLICAIVQAEEVTLGTNQTDYYFLIGENAGFLIDVSNSFNESITGQFSFTLTQQQKTGNSMTQSSNSQSQSIQIDNGTASLVFELGPQQAVGEHVFQKGKFEYTGPDGIGMIVTLEDVTIHIIENPEEKKESEPGECESQTAEEAAEEQQQAREEAEKQREEELRRQMQQQQEADKIENKVQNSQMNQNTGALKSEMQDQLKQENQAKERMQKALQQDQEFQDMVQELIDEGYNITGAELTPTGNESGEFEVDFENPEGDQAKISGKTEGDEVTSLDSTKSLSMENMMEKLKDHPDYKKYDEELSQGGFTQGTPSLQGSDIMIEYTDSQNQTAQITATFNETEIEEVDLSRNRTYWPYLIPFFILAGLIAVLAFREKEEEPEPAPSPIDYRKHASKMISQAKKLYAAGKAKDAYGKVGEAVRFFMSYDMDIRKQLTNNQVLREMRKKKRSTTKMRECLNLCSLVEFAKYNPNDKDFGRIVSIAEKIIS